MPLSRAATCRGLRVKSSTLYLQSAVRYMEYFQVNRDPMVRHAHASQHHGEYTPLQMKVVTSEREG